MGTILLGIWLIVFGIAEAGWVSVDAKLIGIFAVIVGIVLLVDHLR